MRSVNCYGKNNQGANYMQGIKPPKSLFHKNFQLRHSLLPAKQNGINKTAQQKKHIRTKKRCIYYRPQKSSLCIGEQIRRRKMQQNNV